ncbi:MAG: monovalent cation:proton antiporter-2 (CPA2) family protein [Proteobacteria bacterium]|nr:monovalent cation:proton antiporter-2 (CPA2) family protein [Pseudomonadota bacterium]
MATEGGSQLVQVVTLLGAAVVAVPLFKRIGLGSVLGYLAAGLVIGRFGLGWVTDSQSILHIAELGVVMFLFVIGLEMKPSHLWSMRRQIFGLGSLQILVCAVLMTLVGIWGFDAPPAVAFVAAAGFVLTSTAIVMQVLAERGDIAQPRGQRIVAILLFEDLLIVPLLALVALLSPNPGPGGSLWADVGIAASALAALVGAGLWLLNPLFSVLAGAKAREVMTAAALLVVLGAALLMEMGGLSMAMGAFVAGVLLSESSFRHQLEADIEPFRGLLLGLFFLGVGMALDLAQVRDNWRLVLAAVVALMLAKALCIYVVARLAKSSHSEAVDRAILMAQGGEFAFVLYDAAVRQGVIDGVVNANMTAVIVLSMVFTPMVVALHKRFERVAAPDVSGLEAPEDLKGNVLVIGFGRMGQISTQAVLAQGGATISLIDNDPEVVRDSEKYGFKVYYGDGARADILHAAGASHARAILVCVDDKKAATAIVDNARRECPHVKLIVRAWDREHAVELIKHDADVVLRETFESALAMGREAVLALGVEPEEADLVIANVRQRDKERFALETAGGLFAGRDLVLSNMTPSKKPA